MLEILIHAIVYCSIIFLRNNLSDDIALSKIHIFYFDSSYFLLPQYTHNNFTNLKKSHLSNLLALNFIKVKKDR